MTAQGNAGPRVSVITIFLNEQRFLHEAVESVLAQTYRDWELLLVDDGSTDASSALARSHAARHPGRIRYLEHDGHQNRGMSASRNLGIRHAAGEYIGFLDADDVWLPHKLEQQVRILDAHPGTAFVYGRSELWYSWTGDREDRDRDHRLALGLEPDRVVQPPALVLIMLRNEVQLPGPSDVLFRRSVLEGVGAFDDTFQGMFEDIVVLTKVSLRAPIYVSDQQWFRYRQHADSCVARADAVGAIAPARLRLLTWIERYLEEQGVGDRAVWRALRRELRPYRNPRAHAVLHATQRLVWRMQGASAWLAGQVLPARALTWLRRVRGRT